jgi:hypothetical protein
MLQKHFTNKTITPGYNKRSIVIDEIYYNKQKNTKRSMLALG